MNNERGNEARNDAAVQEEGEDMLRARLMGTEMDLRRNVDPVYGLCFSCDRNESTCGSGGCLMCEEYRWRGSEAAGRAWIKEQVK